MTKRRPQADREHKPAGRSAFVPADTTPEAYEAQNEAYRRMGGEGRTAVMFELIALARETTKAGIHGRHPDYDEGQVHRAYCRLLHGDEVVQGLWPGEPLLDP